MFFIQYVQKSTNVVIIITVYVLRKAFIALVFYFRSVFIEELIRKTIWKWQECSGTNALIYMFV